MPYDGRAVANLILDCAEKERIPMSNLVLQKILFFCHAWNLVEEGEPLVKHQFEAWQHGPVLQYIYRQFRNFEANPITSRATKLDPFDGTQKVVTVDLPDHVKDRVERVVSFYGKLQPWDLVELSHESGGPWDKVWHYDGKVNPGMKIQDDSILDFYSKADPSHRIQ